MKPTVRAETARAHEAIIARLRSIAGVVSVGASSSITMDGWDSGDPMFVEEFPVENNQLPPIRRFKWISGDYHRTMGNPVLVGRTITWADIHDRARVVVMTENLAKEYWDEPRIRKENRQFLAATRDPDLLLAAEN